MNMIDQKIKNEQKLAEEKAKAEAEAVAIKETRSNEKVSDIVPVGSNIISKPVMTAQAKLLVDKVEDDFVTIPSGSYRTNCENCKTDGTLVKIKEFKMLRKEVTQDLYQMVMGTNPSKYNDCGKCPVENVSWQDAQIFINKLNEMSNGTYTYRLPTEREWEYAALGGEETEFSGSDDVEKVAWYKLNSTGTKISVNKAKNKFGLYSMSGNVSEWVAEKVVKGGSWNDNVRALQIRKKAMWPADTQNPFIGFRIIRE